jgi:hypothetical protein
MSQICKDLLLPSHYLKISRSVDTDLKISTSVVTNPVTEHNSEKLYPISYPETKQQSSQRKSPSSPRPKEKARQIKSNIKSMLICYIYIYILTGLFIRSSSLLVRQSLKNSIAIFSNVILPSPHSHVSTVSKKFHQQNFIYAFLYSLRWISPAPWIQNCKRTMWRV